MSEVETIAAHIQTEYPNLVAAGDVDGIVAVAADIETATGVSPVGRGWVINAIRQLHSKPTWEPGESLE